MIVMKFDIFSGKLVHFVQQQGLKVLIYNYETVEEWVMMESVSEQIFMAVS